MTHAVENLCLFRCLLCPVKETFDKLCSLQTHYAKAHGRQTKVSFGPKFLAEARYHRCWECRRVLLCEKRVSQKTDKAQKGAHWTYSRGIFSR